MQKNHRCFATGVVLYAAHRIHILRTKKQVHIAVHLLSQFTMSVVLLTQRYYSTIFFMAVMAARNSAPHTSMEWLRMAAFTCTSSKLSTWLLLPSL